MMLHVKVIEARDLPKMDLFGKIDPYVLIQVSGSKTIERTKTIDKNYNPKWNQQFHFSVPSLAETLHFLLKDKDVGSSDDPVSKLEIPLNSIPRGQIIDRWYDLRPLPGVKKGGQIHIALHLCGVNDQPWVQLPPPPMMGQPGMMPPPPQGYAMPPPMMGQPGMMPPPPRYPMQPPMMQPGMMPPPQGYPMQPPMMGQPGMMPPQGYPMQQPMMGQPGMMQPGMMPQPGMMQPGMMPAQGYPMQQPMMGQPGMQQPRY